MRSEQGELHHDHERMGVLHECPENQADRGSRLRRIHATTYATPISPRNAPIPTIV
jgi:hypothetical protein